MLSLFDEPDLTVWRSVIRSIHPDHPGVRDRLRQFAQSHGDKYSAATALCVLAHMKDASTILLCQDWLKRSPSSRNAAVEALRLLGSDAAVELLKHRWSSAGLTDEDRNTLALTHFGHPGALDHACNLADSATSGWSVAAATALYLSTTTKGLRCMVHILDAGTLDAKQAIVHQISSLAGHLPHEYTVDGIHEARLWVETKLGKAS